MEVLLLLAASVLLLCVLLNKLSDRAGIPMLLVFLVLGMLFGTDGIVKLNFDNYRISEQICSVALIFIMFYGGFGTNWREARPVAAKAVLLSTVGVALTALLTGLFCFFILKFELLESLLLGALVSSTDAASVFYILRSRKLGLKDHTDSLLELESGSNDPASYMLTVIVLTLMKEGMGAGSIVGMVAAQFLFGLAVGFGAAFAARFVLRRVDFETSGFDMAFVIGIVLLTYSMSSMVGGNGYLSVYICGIILGNTRIGNKKTLVHFFDGITGLMQILIFFLLGLLSTPSRILNVALPAVLIMVFLTLVARPASILLLLRPFGCRWAQLLLVSFAGLRGAASIVFAIMATVDPAIINHDIFHMVFCIVLLSITVQGTLLPMVARKLAMTDSEADIMKTFSDYAEYTDLKFIQVRITKEHPWLGRSIQETSLLPDTLVVLILRNGEKLVPDGSTVFQEGDTAIVSAYTYDNDSSIKLKEQKIESGSEWVGRQIIDFSPEPGELVIMIIRNGTTIVPNGSTVIEKNDTMVIHSVK